MAGIVWSGRALDHLEGLRRYIAEHNPGAAEGVAFRILEHTKLLGTSPNAGRPGRVPGTRELVVPGMPFIVAYTVERDRAVILAVLHGARRWPDDL